MNRVDLSEIKEKERRVRRFLDERGFDGMIIGRKDNFAWFTCGGTNEIVVPSEAGFALLLITENGIKLVAQIMDGQRIVDEELNGLEVEYVPLHWYESSREEKAAELVRGITVISDIPVEGTECLPESIYSLHYPLTEAEIGKARQLGKVTEGIIRGVADTVKPGMTEQEIAGMFQGEYGREGIKCDVLLVGSDGRIEKYRHPFPSDKPVDRYVLLHPAVQKWGLHANVTRSIYFGKLPEETRRKHEAACRIEAAAVSMCKPGEKFSRILDVQKEIYRETGFGEEWRYHFQGGITGYLLADPALCNDPGAEVSPNQAYDWFITITGVKVEELSINTGSGREICSVAGAWPTDRYEYGGESYELPQILCR